MTRALPRSGGVQCWPEPGQVAGRVAAGHRWHHLAVGHHNTVLARDNMTRRIPCFSFDLSLTIVAEARNVVVLGPKDEHPVELLPLADVSAHNQAGWRESLGASAAV